MTTVKMIRVSPIQSFEKDDHLHEDVLSNKVRTLESEFGRLISLTLLHDLWANKPRYGLDTVFVAVFQK